MTEGRGWRMGRLEGDKLAVLASGADAATELLVVLEAACRTFRVELPQQAMSIPATATAGVAIFQRHGASAHDLLRNADIALDRAKLNQRGAAVVFTGAMRRSWQQETDALAEARTALDRDLIVPFYQPKMAPASGRIVGWEALLRIQRGPRYDRPQTIAEALDDPDLSREIGLRMRSKVLAQIALWQGAGVDTGVVSLNASPVELASVGFAQRFLADLVEFGVLPSSVGIEVTESAVIGGNSGRIATELRQLKSLGVNIALDDFGTGYGSLIHMMDFPLDAIKVDRAFVASLEVSNRARAILSALATLTRDLGLQLVAEGVETPEQLSRLTCLGCDLVQGYLVGKPMPASAVTRYLSERSMEPPLS